MPAAAASAIGLWDLNVRYAPARDKQRSAAAEGIRAVVLPLPSWRPPASVPRGFRPCLDIRDTRCSRRHQRSCWIGDDDTVGAVLGDVEERAAKVAWFHRGLRRIGRWCVFGGYPIVFLINPSVKIPITIAGMYNNHGGVSQGPEFLTSALFAFSGDNT